MNLHRRDVVKELLREREDLLAIAGLGSTAWDITAAGDADTSFPMWGAMGQAAMMGLGLALAQPKRRVLVITGDGEMLMGLGAFATIGVQQPANLTVVVIDNERYGETGMQHTHTAFGVDLAAVAAACRFKHSITVTSDVARVRELAYRTPGPNFAAVKVIEEKLPLVLPPQDGVVLKDRFRRAVLTDVLAEKR
jgi:thiamine pyrophosphate-dependent acetolactate synthase large subunit-like protein